MFSDLSFHKSSFRRKFAKYRFTNSPFCSNKLDFAWYLSMPCSLVLFFQRYNQRRGLVSSFSPLAVPAPAPGPGWLMWNRGSSAISAPWRFQGVCWGQLVNCRTHLLKYVWVVLEYVWVVCLKISLVRVAADFTCPTCNSGEIEILWKRNLCKCHNGRVIVLYRVYRGAWTGCRSSSPTTPRGTFSCEWSIWPAWTGVDHLKVRESTSNIKQVLGPLESLLPGLLGQGVGPVGSLSSRPMGPRAGGLRSVWKILEMYAPLSLPRPRIRIARGGSRPQHLGMDQAALENALQVLTQ